jgi:hypothetical protein
MLTIQDIWEAYSSQQLVEWTPEQLDIARAIFCAGAATGVGHVTLHSMDTVIITTEYTQLSVAELLNTSKETVEREIDGLEYQASIHRPSNIKLN